MRSDDFVKVFTSQYFKLDMFFHGKLYKAKLLDNIQIDKEDLIQDTAAGVWHKLQLPSSETYELSALIWLVAPDVWKRFVKKVTRRREKSVSEYDDTPNCMDVYEMTTLLESADYINALRKNTNEETLRKISLHAEDKFTYSLIAKLLGHSESKIKKDISSFRARLSGKGKQPPPAPQSNDR